MLNAIDVTIMGSGQLYGNAELYIAGFIAKDDEFQPNAVDGSRPHLLLVDNSAGVTVRGIALRNSSDWNFRMDSSRDIYVDGISIQGDSRFPNNDG